MNFGVLVFDQVEELDFIGPWEMLTMWSMHAGGPESCLIVGPRVDAVRCAKGLSINPHVSFADCPDLDYLLVPGGQGTRSEVGNQELLGFLRHQSEHCRAMLSVCTGSFLLHAAGLLGGRRATTHWASLARLRALGEVEVVEERFVRDASIWTSAGVSAGMDMMLAFIAAQAGDAIAGRVQSLVEYYPSGARYGAFEEDPQAPNYLKPKKPTTL